MRKKLNLTTRQLVGLGLVLFGTLAVYMCNLYANGYGNAYYAAAAQAGGHNFISAFFGSLDVGNGVTIDKPPLGVWAVDLSVAIFGLNPIGLMLPQVLMAGATLLVLFFTVRTSFGYNAALFAAITFATTPVVALMFRFNNPDAVLTLLLTAATAAAIRLNRTDHTRWAFLAGGLIGLAFLAKLLQGLLILPGIGLLFLLFGQPKLTRRLIQLLVAGAGLVLAAGWWFAIVLLTPLSARPYQAGTQNGSVWELIFGYNGFGRLTGKEFGNSTFVSSLNTDVIPAPGPLRLFMGALAGQASWLLPLAVVVAVVGFIAFWRTRHQNSQFFETGVWFSMVLTSAAVFSLMKGIFHPYYVVVLVPGISALTGILIYMLQTRRSLSLRITFAVMLAGTGAWSGLIISGTQDFKALYLIPIIAGAATGAFTIFGWQTHRRPDYRRIFFIVLFMTLLAGRAFFTLDTIGTKVGGSNPLAGPIIGNVVTAPTGTQVGASQPATKSTPEPTQSYVRVYPTADPRGAVKVSTPVKSAVTPYEGELSEEDIVTRQLTGCLAAGSQTRWTAAIYGGEQAANIQLNTGYAVLDLGGYSGKEPYPSQAQLQRYIGAHQLRFYLNGTGTLSTGKDRPLDRWVQQHYYGSVCAHWYVYDLTRPIK